MSEYELSSKFNFSRAVLSNYEAFFDNEAFFSKQDAKVRAKCYLRIARVHEEEKNMHITSICMNLFKNIWVTKHFCETYFPYPLLFLSKKESIFLEQIILGFSHIQFEKI